MAPPKKTPPKKPPAKRRQPRSRPPSPPLAPVEQPTMPQARLLGLRLPEVKPSRFHYVPVVVHSGLAYVSGQVPFVDGEIKPTGKVDRDVSIDDAKTLPSSASFRRLPG